MAQPKTNRGFLYIDALFGGLVHSKPSVRSRLWHLADNRGTATFLSAVGVIVLQKSKVVGRRIFRENKKQGAIADSYSFNRIIEAACKFNVRR